MVLDFFPSLEEK